MKKSSFTSTSAHFIIKDEESDDAITINLRDTADITFGDYGWKILVYHKDFTEVIHKRHFSLPDKIARIIKWITRK